jgi:hypothetical protein
MTGKTARSRVEVPNKRYLVKGKLLLPLRNNKRNDVAIVAI